MEQGNDDEALAWQTGVWDKMSDVYLAEVDQRFIPVIDGVIDRAAIKTGDHGLYAAHTSGPKLVYSSMSISGQPNERT